MRLLIAICFLLLCATALCAQDGPWPGQYRIQPWESGRIGPTDVVGPDGIVYPDARPAGVQGGIPAIDDRYRVFDVTDAAYAADGSDQTLDGEAVAAAIESAQAYLRAGDGRRACVYFPAGEYLFDAPLPEIGFDGANVPAHHLVIRGAGPAQTTLRILAGDTGGQLIVFSGETDYGAPYLHLTQTARRGDSRFVFAETLPDEKYHIGDWISIKPTGIPTGSTMAERCNRPEAAVVYDAWHLGRTYFGRVTAREDHALSFDHHVLHDLYVDETPQIRHLRMIEYCGVQDLRIATESADCELDPVRFDYAANCWLRNVHIDHPRNWPVKSGGALTHHEYRDCHFDGTKISINGGSRAYLGWTCYGGVTHSLMIDCRANDLRHMPIFQWAAGCVVTGSSFTGDTVLALQCHGQFPHDILIDDCDFDVPSHTVGIDGTHSLRHGLEGPRFVMHHNRVAGGRGVFDINGGVEGHIYVYNRVRLDDAAQHWPGLSLRDRSWDGIFRGNVLSVTEHSPLVNIEDPTCGGWTIADNRVYGSNGRVWEGSSRPRLVAGNRFFPALADQSDLPEAEPAVDSLYDWQLQHADSARLLLVAPGRDAAAGSVVQLVLVRVADDELPALEVRIESLTSGWADPGTVRLAVGERVHRFQLPVPDDILGTARLRVSADGYLDDDEAFQIFDAFDPPERGARASDYASALPGPLWRAGDYGRVAAAGSAASDGDRITLQGNGVQLHTWDGNLGRSGCFFAYQAIAGDGGLVARLVSTDNADQAGIRWLDDEATMTQHMHLFGDGRVLASPILSGFNTDELHASLGLTPPVWLKLERQGAHFTAWYGTSEDEPGAGEWTAIDLDPYKDHDHLDYYQDPADPDYSHKPDDYKSRGVIDPVMYFGLFVNQDNGAELGTAVFEGVRFFGEVLPRVQPVGRHVRVGATRGSTAIGELQIIHLGDGSLGRPDGGRFLFPSLPPTQDAVFDLLMADTPSNSG